MATGAAALSQHWVRPDQDTNGLTKHEVDVSWDIHFMYIISFKSYNK